MLEPPLSPGVEKDFAWTEDDWAQVRTLLDEVELCLFLEVSEAGNLIISEEAWVSREEYEVTDSAVLCTHIIELLGHVDCGAIGLLNLHLTTLYLRFQVIVGRQKEDVQHRP